MAIENMEERIHTALSELFDAEVAEQAELENLGGHASLRIYWRVGLPTGLDREWPRGESTLMAMVLPQGEAGKQSEEAMDGEAPDELPFVNVQRYLASIEVPVPDIDFVDEDLGVLLLEDLGDDTFEDAVLEVAADAEEEPEARHAEVVGLYREALDRLIDYQERVLRSKADEGFGDPDDCIGFEREFTRETLRWELDHYVEWGLEAKHGAELVDPYREELDEIFDGIVEELWDLLDMLVLRDYQSRNLMAKDDVWHIIDFQDALLGPYIYDVVALLRDSYIVLDAGQVDTLLDYYITEGQERLLPWCGQPDSVREAFYLQTVQRKLKDAGRFVYIDRVKGDPSFLEYYESSIGYVREALERLPGHSRLAEILTEIEPAF